MKYLPYFLLSTAAVFSLASCAVPSGGTAGGETQLGPHSAQKFTLASRMGGVGARVAATDDLNFPPNIALVLTVEQKMNGEQQEIIARASAHKDGPKGSLVTVDGLRVHVLQPSDFGTEPRKTAEARITNTNSAPGGKYKTVVAEATLNSRDYSTARVELTIPGDQ